MSLFQAFFSISTECWYHLIRQIVWWVVVLLVSVKLDCDLVNLKKKERNEGSTDNDKGLQGVTRGGVGEASNYSKPIPCCPGAGVHG